MSERPSEGAGPLADSRSGAPSSVSLFARFVEERNADESEAFRRLLAENPACAAELEALRADWEVLGELHEARSFVERVRAPEASEAGPERDAPAARPGESFAADLLERLAGRAQSSARYRLQGEVARGGQGVIVHVWDEDLRRNLAMKVLLGRAEVIPTGKTPPVDDRSLGRFLEEAQVTSQLDHPGIVPVHELGLDAEGRVYFTMKLVKGEDLRSVFEKVREGREGWTRARALGLLLRACEAMAYAHSKGVVHRDLKPANVMVGAFGEVFVMDWGLARVLGSEDRKDIRIRPAPETSSLRSERRESAESDSPLVTMDGEVVGTPAYMPPEQALGRQEEVGPRSDVYAVGAMLYHLLAGHMPYVKPSMRLSNHAVWFRVQTGPPDPIAERAQDAPGELVAICEKAMAREASERYPDMGALAEDLRAFLERRVVAAYRTGAHVELRKWVERNPALAGSLAAGVLTLAAGLVASLVLKAQSDRNAVMAEARRSQAEHSQLLAETRRDEVLRLSAHEDLALLLAEADGLWPARPERIADYESWISRARVLAEELPLHRAKRAELRSRALPWSAEELEAQRRAHPSYPELRTVEGRIACAERALAQRRDGKAAALPDVDWSQYPQDAWRLAARAWERVRPERALFGEEPLGLVLARRALEVDPKDPDVAHALAHAYFALGRDDDALNESAHAVELAGAEREQEFADLLLKLEELVAGAASPEGIHAAEAELEKLAARRAELAAQVDQPRDWRFPESEPEARWWNGQLTKLIDGLEGLEAGLLAEDVRTAEHGWSVPKRLAAVRALAADYAAGGDRARAWEAALPAIRAAYPGVELEAELGLVPIGPDPDSGLWEFADVQTGDVPGRDGSGRLVLDERSALVLVLLPGGTFTMGAQAWNPAGPSYDPFAQGDESPLHAVTLSPFFLSKYEMTQGQWLRFTGRNPSVVNAQHYGQNWNRPGHKPDLTHPVESVSWLESTAVCARLGLALPSEAQWEYAARAGSTSAWWTGNERESLGEENAANLADRYAREHGSPTWTSIEDWLDDGYTTHAPVGSFAANALGLFDVHGNVWEWCRDGWYDDFYARSPELDPVADPAGSAFRINRGGAFDESAASARSAFRNRTQPDGAGYAFGLRPARALGRPAARTAAAAR